MKKYFAALLALLLLFPLLPTARAEGGTAIYDTFAAQPPHCKSALLMDAETGAVLYSYQAAGAEEHSYPASTTKIMTALLILEAVDRGDLDLDQVVTASSTFDRDLVVGGSNAGIQEGEQLTLRDLLYCALLPSANEACNIMAETLDGDISVFVERMNERAAQLGMENTHFANAHGLHRADHYTTAYDLALLTRQALQNETFKEIVISRSYIVPATNLSEERKVTSTNALINPLYSGAYTYSKAIGVKTGSTSEAGKCLVSAAVGKYKADKDAPGKSNPPATLICVVLGSEEVKGEDGSLTRYQFTESKRLLQWGFESFSRKTVLDVDDTELELPVTLSANTTAVALRPAESLEVVLPEDVDPSTFSHDFAPYAAESLEAPFDAGQGVGTMTVRDGDQVYGTVELVTGASAERSTFLWLLRQAGNFFSQTWVKALLIALAVGVVLLIVRFGIFKPRSGYHGKGRRDRSHQGQNHRRR